MFAPSNSFASGSRPSPRFRSPRENETLTAIQQRLAQTPSLLPWVDLLGLAAEHDVPLLITGETGAGKTWLARIIHDCSPWRNEPFVTVACGALPAQLVESEFFGHVRGAFTGADRVRTGKLAAAGRGTLLLDEIDMLSLEQQAKLLRVLDSGEFEPLGSNETQRRTCRVVAASNADLGVLVRRGEFRSDLYYRLHVLSFHLPPLRQRVEDIAALAKSLAARYAAQFGKELLDIDPDALAVLESYSWPGNLRELDNVMRQAVLLGFGEVLMPYHLPDEVRHYQTFSQSSAAAMAESLRSEREAAERDLMRRVLANPGQNCKRAAEQLGISRVTLHKKMKKYGLALA